MARNIIIPNKMKKLLQIGFGVVVMPDLNANGNIWTIPSPRSVPAAKAIKTFKAGRNFLESLRLRRTTNRVLRTPIKPIPISAIIPKTHCSVMV